MDENEQYCRKNHNACFLTVTNRPYYALLSCKNIAKGETIQAYYGPASGFSWTVRERKNIMLNY